MSHTPGPWELTPTGSLGAYVEGRRSWTHIASVFDETTIDQRPAGEINGPLLLAAPELLTIAVRSAETFRMYEQLHAAKGTPEGDKKAASNRAVAEACEAVIAKARGESG